MPESTKVFSFTVDEKFNPIVRVYDKNGGIIWEGDRELFCANIRESAGGWPKPEPKSADDEAK